VKVLVDLSDSPALNKTLPPAPTDDDPSSPSKRLFPASSASNKSTSGVLKDKNGREGSVEPIPDKDGKRKVSGSHKEKADKPAQEKIQPLKQEEEEDEDEDEDILFDVPSREKIVAPPKPRLTRVVNPPTSVPPHVLPSRSATKSIRSPVPAPRSTRSTSSSPISVSSSRPSERISLSPEPEAELISIDPSQQVLPDSSADISIISSSSAVSVPSEEDADSSVLVLSTLETLTLSGEKSSPSSPIPSRSPIPSSQPASPPSQTLSSPLTQILTACSQPLTSTLPSFTSVLASHSFFPSSTSSSLFRPTITKIGEATYSEVYSISPSPTEEGGEMLVMKVIPLLSDEQSLELEMTKLSLKPEKPEEEGGEGESQQEDELEEADPVWSDARDVAREIELGRAVGVLDGFCTLREAVVVEGTYPPILLAEWDAYRTSFPEKSENARPSVFSSTQRYAILIQSYGGVDLESFAPSTTAPWAEAAGIFWSVGASLARAEEELRFEVSRLGLPRFIFLIRLVKLINPPLFSFLFLSTEIFTLARFLSSPRRPVLRHLLPDRSTPPAVSKRISSTSVSRASTAALPRSKPSRRRGSGGRRSKRITSRARVANGTSTDPCEIISGRTTGLATIP
jgi:hypothetical protein